MPANRTQLQLALQNPYDRILFAKNVLLPIFNSSFTLNSNLVKPSDLPNTTESAVIDSVGIFGKITLEDTTEVTCYEIALKPGVRLEYSKVAIQHYVRKLLTAGQAALICFKSPSNKNSWRLTLVAKDSVLTEKGIKEKTTNAKRYTYLLGPSETCKTPAERFELLSVETKLDMDILIKAFSVEKLSKSFFDEYTRHYDNFVTYLMKPAIKKSVFNGDDKAIRDFSKKLLGRIVFLYFVQKKGWLGATNTNYTDGKPDFIMRLFDLSGGNASFYPNWLSSLFFDTLNNSSRKDDNFEMPDGEKVKIPFLNGGLFDKEEFDDKIISFPSDLFHNKTDEDDPKERGFLDFLNAFNFTVYEDSPDEKTVAVDPEMLGHIFENLLEDNKDKGAFYTPKEIVHYMCQESLIEYLTTHLSKEYIVYQELGKSQIDLYGNEARFGQLNLNEQIGEKALYREDFEYIVREKDISRLGKEQLKKIDKLLDSVKICDPAIGSGAFPMGLLQEIYSIKEIIAYATRKEWKPAAVKENIIQNSIYGVDIEKGAVDIARLRFWLSLVVDEETPKPLPNLDFKIVVGDSLVSKFDGEVVEIEWNRQNYSTGQGEVYMVRIKELLIQITEKQKKYFHPELKNKNKLKKEIRQLKIELLINQVSFNKLNYLNNNSELIDSGFGLTAKEKTKNAEIKFEIAKFDNLIKKLTTLIKKTELPFNHFDWKLDFPEILNPYLVGEGNGFDIVIANPPYIDVKNLSPDFVDLLFKRFNTTENRINLYSIFIEKGWTLTNSNGNLCYINPNSLLINSSYKKVRKLLINNINKIIKLPDNVFINATVETMIFSAIKGKTSEYIWGAFYKNNEKIDFDKLNFRSFQVSNWLKDNSLRFNIFISQSIFDILHKIEKASEEKLQTFFDFSLGITPYDKYKGHSKKLIETKGFHSKTKIDLTYVPLISGNNVTKYYVSDNIEEFLKYGNWLGAPRQRKFFTSPRVIVRQIISGNPPSIYAGFTEKELYHTQIAFSIIQKAGGKYSPKLLCAFLNSTLMSFYHKYKFTDPEKNTFQKILIENCKELPIKTEIHPSIICTVERLVDYILFLKSQVLKDINEQLMLSFYLQIIDSIIYELYFKELLEKHKRDIIKYIDEIPQINDNMSAKNKMKIIKDVFDKLNEKNHPVRINLFYMDSIPEIRIIEGKDENNIL